MKIVKYTLLSISFIGLVSCTKSVEDTGTEYAPAMYHSRAYEPLTQVTEEGNDYYNSNPNNPYKMNMRALPKNTIKISHFNPNYYKNPEADLFLYKISKDTNGQAKVLASNPIVKSEAVIAEGKELYGRYCQHCHGETGKGDGPVGQVFGGVPNYAGAAKDRTESSIYYTITYGRNRMGAHGSQINVLDRWKIVHYVQTLQNQ